MDYRALTSVTKIVPLTAGMEQLSVAEPASYQNGPRAMGDYASQQDLSSQREPARPELEGMVEGRVLIFARIGSVRAQSFPKHSRKDTFSGYS